MFEGQLTYDPNGKIIGANGKMLYIDTIEQGTFMFENDDLWLKTGKVIHKGVVTHEGEFVSMFINNKIYTRLIKGKHIFDTGVIHEGDFGVIYNGNDLIHGKCIFKNGGIHEGEFEVVNNIHRMARGKMIHPNGSIINGEFKYSLSHILINGEHMDINGNIYTGNFTIDHNTRILKQLTGRIKYTDRLIYDEGKCTVIKGSEHDISEIEQPAIQCDYLYNQLEPI